ncbi:hypothetical protein WKR88_22245 [Trinickia caryophylli]|uniref:Glycosyltransferase family 1 protein n=1 Tax=Trinickia caryophylli TaxID=28094 RepID=A0A1X7CP14_TRICW|nr:hypothetical protein [Trinickia caryophylli]PMS11272.1 hypothetical protein C0Z17_15765 [Trinickia caryophylli]TRX20125.1 hypothetical protein FNF07_19325 [Trinickia caryophylli]WQE12524.1 hypothetical protein U0034_03620 [Trinickia caryophylli]SMF00015.1 hypothetical protein SAMN06295900_101685 [Trinickia caryophylli]GLU30209.1 hypothetical protein Busp01_00510 [Trinickia caryophylli]
MSNKPSIHLWIYNHPFYGISDQVEFFVAMLTQNGYPVTVGRKPSVGALNVVIENFSPETCDVLIAFCRATKKRVAVIMTEHLDFDQGEIFIHGAPLWSDNDYMHPTVQVRRIVSLLDCLPYIRCMLVLGDLPELKNISEMLPGLDVRAIPFPRLDPVDDAQIAFEPPGDLLFTGVMTDFRAELYAQLKRSEFSVAFPQRFVSRKARDALNRSAKVILNMPQRKDWRWLSLMRIVAALRCGRATVSLGTCDQSKIAACTYQIDISRDDWTSVLRAHVDQWRTLYRTAFEDYAHMADSFERERRFPHDLFDFWAMTDRLGHRPAVSRASTEWRATT